VFDGYEDAAAVQWDWDDLSDGDEGCAEGYVEDCADDDCCLESWIGDGFTDCEDQQYGCDLTCYDDDGGECDGFVVACADTDCGSLLGTYECYELIGFGYDCSVCEAEGVDCSEPSTCDDEAAYNFGEFGDCEYLPDGWDEDLCPGSYAFDSWCDCGCGGADTTCDDPEASLWQNCETGFECAAGDTECSEIVVEEWDESISGLTAEGVGFDSTGDGYEDAAAVRPDIDSSHSSTTISEHSVSPAAHSKPVSQFCHSDASGSSQVVSAPPQPQSHHESNAYDPGQRSSSQPSGRYSQSPNSPKLYAASSSHVEGSEQSTPSASHTEQSYPKPINS
jgi:hypothetical protein